MKLNRCRFRRPAAGSAVVVFVLLFGALPANSQPPDNIEYTFARRNDTLVVWLNLARYFGANQLEALADGVDYSCDYTIALKRPRRLWGAEQIAHTAGRVRLSYRPITQNYALTVSDSDSLNRSREFVLTDRVLGFLRDSIWVPLIATDGMDRGTHYIGDLSVSVISLTTFNLAANEQPDSSADSPVKYLFRQFLKATGYGREDFSTSSRKFSLSEVYPID